MFKLDLYKAEEPEIKLPTSIGSLKKQQSSRKSSTSALLTTPKPLTIKWLSEEALQIAVKRKVKGKGEKERYSHLNAEFQRIARRDNKAFLSYQCKEIEENNRMGKTRVLFKKIRDTKGKFQAKMVLIKDRNGMDLTEAEDIKNRWQEYRGKTVQKRSS